MALNRLYERLGPRFRGIMCQAQGPSEQPVAQLCQIGGMDGIGCRRGRASR